LGGVGALDIDLVATSKYIAQEIQDFIKPVYIQSPRQSYRE